MTAIARAVWVPIAAGFLLACGGDEAAPVPEPEPVPMDDGCEEVEICNGLDDNCDGRIDEGVLNACGGCAALDPEPLAGCGQCGGGTVICATPNATICVGGDPLNRCGGCGVLPRDPGAACGTCDTGELVCDGLEGVVCEGDAGGGFQNACGGCAELEPLPDLLCGTCDTGVYLCDGTERTRCVGDLGDAAFNVCGQCGPIPEEGCGACGDGVLIDGEECDDGNAASDDGCSADCLREVAWVRVEPGTFTMGSPEDEPGRRSTEPRHTVTIARPYLIRATEITRQEWEDVMGIPNPSLFVGCGLECPVSRVSWWDAVGFANRLSEQAGLEPCYALAGCSGGLGAGCRPEDVSCIGGHACDLVQFAGLDCEGYRLPTEAEWEYAARAGTQTAFASGDIEHTSRSPLDRNLNTIGWYAGNSSALYSGGGDDCSEWFDGAVTCGPQVTGGKLPNPWGVFDMSGNVWEWVWDYNGSYPTETVTDPLGPDEGESRLRRGGSWSSPAQFCRSAFRFANNPAFRSIGLGFRIARTVPEP